MAGDLLEDLAAGEDLRGGGGRRVEGSRVSEGAAKAWWAKAEKVGEEAYLVGRVLPPAEEAGRTAWPRSLPLRVIAVKYPKRLPEVYRTLLQERPDVPSHDVAEAVAKSSLPAEEKAELFAAAGRHGAVGHRLPALLALKGLDAKRFDALLLATVGGLPKDVTEEYWRAAGAGVARLVVMSDDQKVWAAFEAAVERASFGLRSEMLHHLATGVEPRRRADRLRLLAAHLDDAEVLDRKEDKRLRGSRAGFGYDRITVGDAVAHGLAELLGVEVRPKPDRTAAEWAGVREQVRKAVKAELDKSK